MGSKLSISFLFYSVWQRTQLFVNSCLFVCYFVGLSCLFTELLKQFQTKSKSSKIKTGLTEFQDTLSSDRDSSVKNYNPVTRSIIQQFTVFSVDLWRQHIQTIGSWVDVQKVRLNWNCDMFTRTIISHHLYSFVVGCPSTSLQCTRRHCSCKDTSEICTW